MKKHKNKLIILSVTLILLTVFLFSKGGTSKKILIGQNEYSVYAKAYVYAELLCVFSIFDCDRAGVIYLYDEVEGKVLESVSTGRIGAIESVSWLPEGNVVYFKASQDIEIKNNEWVLPRSLQESKE